MVTSLAEVALAQLKLVAREATGIMARSAREQIAAILIVVIDVDSTGMVVTLSFFVDPA